MGRAGAEASEGPRRGSPAGATPVPCAHLGALSGSEGGYLRAANGCPCHGGPGPASRRTTYPSAYLASRPTWLAKKRPYAFLTGQARHLCRNLLAWLVKR